MEPLEGPDAPDAPDRQPRILYAPRTHPRPGPSVAQDLERYRRWVAERERVRLAGAPAIASPPAPQVGLLMVVEQPDPALLERCLRSVADQTFSGWEISAVVLGGEPSFGPVEQHHPARVRVTQLRTPMTPAAAAQLALTQCASPYVALLGQHDFLAPDALAWLIDAVVEDDAAIAYADEDQVDETGRASEPALKPDWSPELLTATPYLGRPLLVRRHLLGEGFDPEMGNDWEYDAMLRATERATERATSCHHVPEVLYHRSPGAAAPAVARPDGEANHRALDAALRRRGDAGTVAAGPLPDTWRIDRPIRGRPTVRVIVPFRDGATLLRSCMDSLAATVPGNRVDLQMVLVDNGSTEPETLALVERYRAYEQVRVLRDDRPFNWAALNNAAVASEPDHRADEVLLFLNNDIEAKEPGWLETLVAQALRPEVAVVGARLLYPNDEVQHVGMVVGLGGVANHLLRNLASDDPGYLGMAVLTRDCSAVTGACLATRRSIFEELGHFDETLGVDTNDVDYCLRARAAGYRVIFEPRAQLLHHEGPSRGASSRRSDLDRFLARWGDLIGEGDPYLNANLTRMDPWCGLAGDEEREGWQRWGSTHLAS